MTDSRAVIETRLLEAETALHRLLTGKSAVSLSRGDSAGNSRTYQYTPTDVSQLKLYISWLKGQLGLDTGRQPPAGVRL